MEETTFAYDATWLAALALNKTESPALRLGNFSHDESYSKAIYENALQVKFQGASVSCTFEEVLVLCVPVQ